METRKSGKKLIVPRIQTRSLDPSISTLPNYLDIGYRIRLLLFPLQRPQLSDALSGNNGTPVSLEFSYIDLNPDIKQQIRQLFHPLLGRPTISYDPDFLLAVRSLIVGGSVYNPNTQKPQHSALANTTVDLNTDAKTDVSALFEEYKRRLQALDCSTICGLVWTSQYYAYRCRTCALSPCMSLCATCFRAADHTGHDFNMFKSHAGGACDCGDESVMRPNGFCSRHGTENTRKNRATRPPVPSELVAVPRLVVEQLIARLLLELRASAAADNDRIDSFDPLFELLNSMLDCGSVFRELIISILLDAAFFEAHEIRSLDQRDSLLQHQPPQTATSPGFDAVSISSDAGHACLIDLIRTFTDQLSTPHESSASVNSRQSNSLSTRLRAHESSSERDRLSRAVLAELSAIQYGRPLEEFVFWLIYFKLPQSLVTFLLNQLPDEIMKEQFARVFTRQYVLVTQPLSNSPPEELQSLANRVVHVSVQLLSNEALARSLVVEERMLDRLLLSLRLLLSGSLTRCKYMFRAERSTLAQASSEPLASFSTSSSFAPATEYTSLSSVPATSSASGPSQAAPSAMDTSDADASWTSPVTQLHDVSDAAEHFSDESEEDSSADDSYSDSSAGDLSALTHIVLRSRLVPRQSGHMGLMSLLRRGHEPRHWPRALDCTTEILRTHSYWPFTSDFINLLHHREVCLRLLFDEQLLSTFLDVLALLQGMNLIRRQLSEHEEFEPDSYYSSFTAEMELSASNMWLLWNTLRQMALDSPHWSAGTPTADSSISSVAVAAHTDSSGSGGRCSRGDLLVRFHGRLLSALALRFRAWLQQLLVASTPHLHLDVAHVSEPLLDRQQLTFHLPLVRYISVFANLVLHELHASAGSSSLSVAESRRILREALVSLLLPSSGSRAAASGPADAPPSSSVVCTLPAEAEYEATSTLRCAAALTMQTLSGFFQVHAGLWVRNGHHVRGQAMTYQHGHFCYSMLDADLSLLQLAAAYMNPEPFLSELARSFLMDEYFALPSANVAHLLPTESTAAMLEAFLATLSFIVTRPAFAWFDDDEVMRKEMVSLLSLDERSHSQLLDALPEKIGLQHALQLDGSDAASSDEAEGQQQSGSGSANPRKRFEFILKQIAEFRAPQFEAAQSALSQGSFALKSNVWLEEYDPLWCFFRSTRRSDYSESISRFVQHLQRSARATQSRVTLSVTDCWLPLRVPSLAQLERQLPASLEPLLDLLLSSTCLHFLATTLYRYLHKDENVPEPVNPTTETPSRSPARASLTDTIVFYCIYLLNLAVLAEVRRSRTRRLDLGDRSLSLDERILSCEALALDQLQEAPSSKNRSLPSILLDLHKKFVSRMSRGSGSSATSGSNTTRTYEYVAYRRRRWIDAASLAERSTQELLLTEIGDRHRNADLAYLYDGPHVIESLLDRLSVVCPRTRDHLELTVGDGVNGLAPLSRPVVGAGASVAGASDAQQMANEKEERKRKAMERQRAILANMAEKQRKFLNQPVIQPTPSVALDTPLDSESTASPQVVRTPASEPSGPVPATTAVPKPPHRESISIAPAAAEAEDTSLTCVICGQSQQLVPSDASRVRDDVPSDDEEEMQPLAMVAFVQQSSILLQRPTAFDASLHYCLPLPSGSARTQSQSTAAANLLSSMDSSPSEQRIFLASRNLKNIYRLVARTLSSNFGPSFAKLTGYEDAPMALDIQSCGHHVHCECLEAYLESLKPQEEQYMQLHFLDLKLSQFFCPLCRQLSNAVVPLCVPEEVILASRSQAHSIAASDSFAQDSAARPMDVDVGAAELVAASLNAELSSGSYREAIPALLHAQFADEDPLRFARENLLKLIPPALQRQFEASAIWWLAWTARCSLETELLLFDERRTASLLSECGPRLQLATLDELARAGLSTLGDPATFTAQADTAVHLQRRTSLLATLLFLRLLALETSPQYLDDIARRLLGLPRESASTSDAPMKDSPPNSAQSKRHPKPFDSSATGSSTSNNLSSPSSTDSELAAAKLGKRVHRNPFHKLFSSLIGSVSRSRTQAHVTPLASRSSAPGTFLSRSELVACTPRVFEAAAAACSGETNTPATRMLAIYEASNCGPLLLYDSTCLALQLLLPLLVPCLAEVVQHSAAGKLSAGTLNTLLRAIASHVIVKTVLGVLLANPSWLVEVDALLLSSQVADADATDERSAALRVLATLCDYVRHIQCPSNNAPEESAAQSPSPFKVPMSPVNKVPSVPAAAPSPNKPLGGSKLLRTTSSEPSPADESTASLSESLAIVPVEAPHDLNVTEWFMNSWLHDEPDFSDDHLFFSGSPPSARIASRPSLSSLEPTVSTSDLSPLSFNQSATPKSRADGRSLITDRFLASPVKERLMICIEAALNYSLRPLALLYECCLNLVAQFDVNSGEWVRSGANVDYSQFLSNSILKRRWASARCSALRILGLLKPDTAERPGLEDLLLLVRAPGHSQCPPSVTASCASWRDAPNHVLLRNWCDELINCAPSASASVAPLLANQLSWLHAAAITQFALRCSTSSATGSSQEVELRALLYMRPSAPRLLQLPASYEQLFTVYSGTAHEIGSSETARNITSCLCSRCGRRPECPALCLICGSLLCMKGNCCITKTKSGRRSLYEVTHHTTECSRSVGLVLQVSSTAVLVVSGRRYAYWGSLYLDEHGEEDRDLKRGRPLFLSAARFRLLELQWRAHAFDRLCRPFHWHRDLL